MLTMMMTLSEAYKSSNNSYEPGVAVADATAQTKLTDKRCKIVGLISERVKNKPAQRKRVVNLKDVDMKSLT